MLIGSRRLTLVVAGGLVIFAPLPFASRSAWPQTLMCILLGLALAGLWWERRALALAPRRFSILILATMLLLASYHIAWPGAIIDHLSPRLAAEARASLVLIGSEDDPIDEQALRRKTVLAEWAGADVEPSPRLTLAADPDGRRDAERRLLLALGAFAAALLAAAHASDRRALIAALAVSGVIQSAYGLAEALSGHQQIYGFVKLSHRSVCSGTFISPNHYAALASLSLFSLIALIFWRNRNQDGEDRSFGADPARPTRTILLATLAGVVLLGMVWSSSRAGLAAAGIALAAVAPFALAGTRHIGRQRLLTGSVVLALVAALILGAWFMRPPAPLSEDVEDLSDDWSGRSLIWESAWRMHEAFPLTGVGPGGFEVVHRLFRPERFERKIVHAHSDYLEWLVETGWLGVPLLLAWLLSILTGLWVVIRRSDQRSWALPLAGGLLALGLHSFVGFALQVPGVAIPAAVLAGTLLSPLCWTPGPAGARRGQNLLWASTVVLLAVALLGTGAVSLYSLRPLSPGSETLSSVPGGVLVQAQRQWARRELNHILRRARDQEGAIGPAETARLQTATRAALGAAQRAPLRAEPRLTTWLAGRMVLASADIDDAARADLHRLGYDDLERATELSPFDRSRRLQITGMWLLQGDPQRARQNTRELLELSPASYTKAYAALASAATELGDLMEATPNNSLSALYLARFLLNERNDRVGARIVLERALSKNPDAPRLRTLLAALEIQRREYEAAHALLRDARIPEDPKERLYFLRTHVRLLVADDPDGAFDRTLSALEKAGEDPRMIDFYLARARLRTQPEVALAAFARIEALGYEGLAERQRLEILLTHGRALVAQQRFSDALVIYRKAQDIDPDHPQVEQFFASLGPR